MQTRNPFPCVTLDPKFRAKSAFGDSSSSLLSVTEMFFPFYRQGEDPNMPVGDLTAYILYKNERMCHWAYNLIWKKSTKLKQGEGNGSLLHRN